MGLITLPRAVQNATLAGLNGSNPAYLGSLIDAASAAIERYCNRTFTSTDYTEFYSPGAYVREPIKLRQFPVSAVTSIGIADRAVQVLNSGNSGAIQKATVQTLANGDLKLVSTASGVVTSNTLSITTYPTVLAVTNAIAALGSGWSTSTFGGAVGSYALFPSADFKPLSGATSAMVGGCYLDLYVDWGGWNTSTGFWPDDGGDWGSASPFWRLQEETGEIYGRFPRGQVSMRVKYTAGFAAIPADIQEACVAMVQQMYQQSKANGVYKEAKLGDSSYTLADAKEWPRSVLMVLDAYKDYSRADYFG